jgi:hypothetical protein
MSRQWSAVAALRERAATVSGWGTTWPVAYAGRIFTPPDDRQWIEEAIGGGPGIPVAMTPPTIVTYRYTGTWTLTLISRPRDGEKDRLDMADLLQTTLLAIPGMTLPGNIPLIIDDVELGPAIPEDGDVRRQLIVRYAFYANATPGTVIVDPSSIVVPLVVTEQLTAHAFDGEGNEITPATFVWASSDPNIATVSNTGLVTPVAIGSCIVTASRNGLQGQCTVTVANIVYGP